MSFFGVQEIIENCNYLNALNEEKGASTEILNNLLPYENPKVRAIEDRLRATGGLSFEAIMNDPVGFYLLTQFTNKETQDLDKVMFLKDVEVYKTMRFENARLKLAKLIAERYLMDYKETQSLYETGSIRFVSVFEALKYTKKRAARAASTGTTPGPLPFTTDGEKSRASMPPMQSPMNSPHAQDDEPAPAPESGQIPVSSTESKIQKKVEKEQKKKDKQKKKKKGAVDEEKVIELRRPTNPIDYVGQSVQQVFRTLAQEKAPPNLFEDVAQEVRDTLIRTTYQEFFKSKYYRKWAQTKQLEDRPVSVEDFQTLRLLGRGGFGTVYACKKIDSGKLYAMKAINKKLIRYKKAVAMTMLERHTLSLVKSRFVCGLAFAFQDHKHLFLIMDLMAGGDLKFHLTKNRSGTATGGFPEERARFHAAEVLLGLEAMHGKNIIFRDLKLENVLLDEQGHCKISDLGLVALHGKKKVNHYAGTPGYIAPEVTKKIAYGPAVDLFSFGVTIYRMLSGKKPFKGHTRQDFDKAVCNDEPVYDPTVFSEDAIDLIKGLLKKEPQSRLGANGMHEIKNHPWFATIDWGLLEIGYLDPPFVPSKHDVNANSLEDIGFEDADAKNYERIHLDEKFRKQIQGFDYVSKEAVRKEIVSALKKQADEEEIAKQRLAQQPEGKECCVVL